MEGAGGVDGVAEEDVVALYAIFADVTRRHGIGFDRFGTLVVDMNQVRTVGESLDLVPSLDDDEIALLEAEFGVDDYEYLSREDGDGLDEQLRTDELPSAVAQQHASTVMEDVPEVWTDDFLAAEISILLGDRVDAVEHDGNRVVTDPAVHDHEGEEQGDGNHPSGGFVAVEHSDNLAGNVLEASNQDELAVDLPLRLLEHPTSDQVEESDDSKQARMEINDEYASRKLNCHRP